MENNENDKLFNAIIKVAAEEAWEEEMDSLPSLEELNEMYPPSESLDKRIYGTINKAARRGKIKKARRITSKLVAGLCVFIVLAGSLLMSVEASRAFILSRIINMGEDYVSIRFELGYAEGLEIGELVINYIPGDFTFYEQGEFAEGHTFYIFRSDTRKGIMIQHLIVHEDMGTVGSLSPMTEDSEFAIISLHGQVAYLVTSTDESVVDSISWGHGRNFLSVSAWLDVDELIKIAEGMTLR